MSDFSFDDGYGSIDAIDSDSQTQDLDQGEQVLSSGQNTTCTPFLQNMTPEQIVVGIEAVDALEHEFCAWKGMNGRTQKGYVFLKTNQISRAGQDDVNGKLAIVFHETKDGPGPNEVHGKFYRRIFQDAKTLNGQVDVKKSLADDADFRPYTWKRWVFLDRRWKAGLAQLRQLLTELRVQKTEFLYDFMGLE